MEETRGPNRGSYIWGRSVHNTRIERLWFDVTLGFGGKWKTFFMELEHYDDLDADDLRHIWLVHHLFLHALNQDAQEWAAVWNAHSLHIRGERTASPHELFMFGVAEHGGRGLSHVVAPPPEGPVDDLVNYGVDWEALNDPALMRHHREQNAHAVEAAPASVPASAPTRLSEVTCDPPRCPLPYDVVAMLNQHLSYHFDLSTRNMGIRRELWRSALAFCRPWFV
ncbi:hypothetical protein OH76DRAFT_1345566 [Lentinus brumalis]|uniref:Integrase core domain-containing protein n=1 Tax=Lentinus brumalis TaxID=2498619 RepID=A0A371DHV3_9APHY|nr:hypothetical protein OH76DRAFT_1345566 [Polyporus brumalis]